MHPILLLVPAALAGDLKFNYPTSLGPNDKPSLLITPIRDVQELGVDCEVGDQTYSFTASNLPGGKQQKYSWDRDPGQTHAECRVEVRFTDDTAEAQVVGLDYSYGAPLKVDLSKATVDVQAHTLTVSVTSRVTRAHIIAYGVGKTILDEQDVDVNEGPGPITLPWVGEASDVVLLDVTVYAGAAWAGFTFSPWLLNIPHEDVLFATDSWEIPTSEEYKLFNTLKQLEDVLARYGDLVPVKLYLAGCTDTVGNPAHNLDLSRNRARAIASWLRSHGYSKPIYYHGYGEGFLAVPTSDNVDSLANRRVLYVVSANPPPAGSGIPSVNWTAMP